MTQDSPTAIPHARALIPRPAVRQMPALHRMALALRNTPIPAAVRAAGALMVGLAVERVLSALVDGRQRHPSSALPVVLGAASAAVPPPTEVARVIETLPGVTRLVITELTIVERSRR